MKRKSFTRLFFGALGYMEMGNLMSLVLTLTLIPFSGNKTITAAFAFCAALVYLSLVFTPAYKDGVNERKLLQNKRAEKAPKFRWLAISLLLWGISLIFALILLLNFNRSLPLIYCAFNGAVSPLAVLVTGKSSGNLPYYAPFLFAGFYTLTVPACLLGFWCGLKDKLNTDKIMYK